MAYNIQFKRGLKKDLPQLFDGEVGYAQDTEELFIGSLEGNKRLTFDSDKHAELTEQLAQTSEQVIDHDKRIGMSDLPIWKSPAQPDSASISPNSAPEGNPTGFADSYYALYDQLVSENPDYITKTRWGYDASGKYPLYTYVFEPEHYEKTIILTSLVHGGEREGFRGLLRVMQHVCNDYTKYPQFLYLRTRVRIVVVPIVNPYGFTISSRYNKNGVDLNRNFNYRWTSKGAQYGTTAASESETQLLQSIINTYKDATLLIDFHNTENVNGSKRYYCTVPVWENTQRDTLKKIINTIQPEPSTQLIHPFSEPTLNNFAAFSNINAFTIEWVPGSFHTAKTSEDVKDMVEFFANCIIQMTRCNKPSFEQAVAPKTYFINSAFLGKTTALSTWTEMDFLRFQIPTNFEGIVEVIASFTYFNSGDTIDTQYENWFATTFEQTGNDYYDSRFTSATTESKQILGTENLTIGGTRQNMSIINAGKFFATAGSGDTSVGDLVVKFWWKTSGGTLNIRRLRIMIKLTPTDNIHRIERWEENTSNGTLYKVYPNNF